MASWRASGKGLKDNTCDERRVWRVCEPSVLTHEAKTSASKHTPPYPSARNTTTTTPETKRRRPHLSIVRALTWAVRARIWPASPRHWQRVLRCAEIASDLAKSPGNGRDRPAFRQHRRISDPGSTDVKFGASQRPGASCVGGRGDPINRMSSSAPTHMLTRGSGVLTPRRERAPTEREAYLQLPVSSLPRRLERALCAPPTTIPDGDPKADDRRIAMNNARRATAGSRLATTIRGENAATNR